MFENDLFVGEDSGYTNGLGLVAALGPFRRFSKDNLPRWLLPTVRRSWLANGRERLRGRAWSVAQTLQTPEDIRARELLRDDVPYVALLAGALSFYAFDERVADRLDLTLGVVGPAALGEPSQRLIHELTGSRAPRGWSNQIGNEPVVQARATRSWRWPFADVPALGEIEAVTQASAAVGNLSSFATGAAILRVGRELALSHPVASVLPDRQLNATLYGRPGDWYAFAGVNLGPVALTLVWSTLPDYGDDGRIGALALSWRR